MDRGLGAAAIDGWDGGTLLGLVLYFGLRKQLLIERCVLLLCRCCWDEWDPFSSSWFELDFDGARQSVTYGGIARRIG